MSLGRGEVIETIGNSVYALNKWGGREIASCTSREATLAAAKLLSGRIHNEYIKTYSDEK